MTRVSLSEWRELTDGEWIASTKLHVQQRTARKEHKCQWCKWPILKGEHYISECWIVDGEFTYERHHLNYEECMPKSRQPEQDEQPYYETRWAPSYR